MALQSTNRSDAASLEIAAASSRRSAFARRSIALGLVWIAIGLALAYFSYGQRLVDLDESGVRVLYNEQGVVAGYCAIAFGVFWLLMGLVASARGNRQPSS